jgi:hypothetical protein
MNIPSEGQRRENVVFDIRDKCLQGIEDRRVLYEQRRRWLFFGNQSDQPVRVNRLSDHIELVSSFLYNSESVKLAITLPSGADQAMKDMCEPASDYLAMTLHQRGVLHAYAEALDWALAYDSMFLKIGWNESRNFLTCKIIEPHSFGVYDEGEGEFEDQDAFLHTYTLNWDDAVRRIARAGRAKEIKRLSVKQTPLKEEYPTVERNLIIAATGGANLMGPILGQARTEEGGAYNYRSQSTHDQVKFQELYVWDEKYGDYAIFTLAGDDILLTDSRQTVETLSRLSKRGKDFRSECNTFLPQEHPFVHIAPYPIYNYFWGEAMTARTIPLQEWTNTRMDQIDAILAKQVDPGRVFSGFSGLSPEKATALNGPGAWVMDQSPGAKVDELKPDMPEDLFRELDKIGELFLERAGLTKTLTGQGQEGVRSHDHAKGLAVTGSGRIRKAALGLERSLGRMAYLSMKLLAHNDDEQLVTESGRRFVLAQLEGDYNVTVSGHTHSPLFADETHRTADELMKTKSINRKSFIKMLNPPNQAQILEDLKKIEAGERQAAQMGMPEPGSKEMHERMRSHHGAQEKQ